MANQNAWNTGRNDAQKGHGMQNTRGLHHQARQSYEAGYKSGK